MLIYLFAIREEKLIAIKCTLYETVEKPKNSWTEFEKEFMKILADPQTLYLVKNIQNKIFFYINSFFFNVTFLERKKIKKMNILRIKILFCDIQLYIFFGLDY